jgi:hypothetical protein
VSAAASPLGGFETTVSYGEVDLRPSPNHRRSARVCLVSGQPAPTASMSRSSADANGAVIRMRATIPLARLSPDHTNRWLRCTSLHCRNYRLALALRDEVRAAGPQRDVASVTNCKHIERKALREVPVRTVARVVAHYLSRGRRWSFSWEPGRPNRQVPRPDPEKVPIEFMAPRL